MGNQSSTSSSSKRRSNSDRAGSTAQTEHVTARAKRVVGDLHEGIKNSVKKLDDDHPAAQLIDHVCGVYFDDEKYKHSRSASYYSEEASEDGSRRTFQSEDDTTYDERRNRHSKSDKSVESASYTTQSDYDSDSRRGKGRGAVSFDTEDESKATTTVGPNDEVKLISKPLASSFAKRCYFTKSGIGKTTQHYEGLTLTGNVVLMLASAMKLKGCPTICDEDLRRVEQTYPNQFSRLPDELLLSSGWRRISKYCHFSNKPIPDGLPFFHSKQRLHPSGGYYFLLAAAVGMVRPSDVEPLTKDTLVLLETDYPTQCDATPSVLIRDPEHWVLVNKFCFFSGGPINTEEDVYYQADFDGNAIFMLAFLSPSLTPEELYKLTQVTEEGEPGLRSIAEVKDVESVYDLTERDFDDLKLYHLGPCRALPQYILQPPAWTKVLPPHFLAARQQAMLRAQQFEGRYVEEVSEQDSRQLGDVEESLPQYAGSKQNSNYSALEHLSSSLRPADGSEFEDGSMKRGDKQIFQREMAEEGSFHNSADNESAVKLPVSSREDTGRHVRENPRGGVGSPPRMDPPEDEPPRLRLESMDEHNPPESHFPDPDTPAVESIGDPQGFFGVEQPLGVDTHGHREGRAGHDLFPQHYVSPESMSPSHEQYFHEFPTQYDEEYYQETPLHSNGDYLENNDSRHRHGNYDGEYPEDPDDQYHDEAVSPANRQYYVEELSPINNEYYEEETPAHSDGQYFEESPTNSRYNGDTPTHYEDAQSYHDTGVFEPDGDGDVDDRRFQHINAPFGALKPTSSMDEYNGIEEKKFGLDKDDRDSHSHIDNSVDFHGKDGPPDRYIDTSANPYYPMGTAGNSGGGLDSTKSHQSSAMRGAHEILKRNRQRRLDVSSAGKPQNFSPSPMAVETPNSGDAGTWDDSGSEVTGSAVSSSSIWTDTSGPADRSSRRALILQMAKARMKTNNKESPVASKSKLDTSITEEGDITVMTEGNTVADFDLTGDLD